MHSVRFTRRMCGSQSFSSKSQNSYVPVESVEIRDECVQVKREDGRSGLANPAWFEVVETSEEMCFQIFSLCTMRC